MISKNGTKAFSDDRYDYYELQQSLGGIVPKGAIFVHDEDDTENGSIANGCLKLCWTQEGNCFSGPNQVVCANTVVFHSSFKDSNLFKLTQRKKNKTILNRIENIIRELHDIVSDLT